MDIDSDSKLCMRIAVIAKYSFYFEDIQNELHNLNIEMVYAEDISQIEQLVAGGMPFEYIFFPHYSKVIPGGFLQLHSCIGFHTGDLPADRGGSPIQHKILKGEYKTWVSAINLIEEIDAGDVLCQEPVSLEHGSIDCGTIQLQCKNKQWHCQHCSLCRR